MSFERREVKIPVESVLIVALEGWIDPGFTAAAALTCLLEQFDTHTFVVFDTDDLIDLRARRPRVMSRDGLRNRVYWQGPRLRVGADEQGHGMAFLIGPEPDFHWKAFSAEVTELAVELGCRLIIGLGAAPAPTPHTRPIPISATASTQELATEVGYRTGSHDRPARMIDVIGSIADLAGIPSISLIARVPHYVSTTPYPAASIALLQALSSVSGLQIDTSALKEGADSTNREVDRLIAQSEEHTEMVRQLEERYHRISPIDIDERTLPSGDQIADELERYLRNQTKD
ncbi:MAG TPA: PAC2 family protein [Acidimicrobiales bacterium]|nr:PAC2 family protein [Acidimicrobiales bacterium]